MNIPKSSHLRRKTAPQRFYRWWRWVWTISAAGAWATLSMAPRAAHGAPFGPEDPGWEGATGFFELAVVELGRERLRPTATLDWSQLTPSDGLLFLHPEVVPDSEDVSAFLRAGGRIAVLDDFGVGDQLLHRYHIDRVPAPSAPRLTLRDNPALAIAEPAGESSTGDPSAPHPVAMNVRRLVTNHPTGLAHPDLSPVLRIRSLQGPDVTLAVAGQVGKGRLFAMGDPSALLNVMLRYPGNRAFATGLVVYLVEDDTFGRRQGNLYVLANRFAEKGSFGSESKAGRQLREAARALSRDVRSTSLRGLPRGALLGLAVMTVTGLLIWVGFATARVYQKVFPRFARLPSLLAQGGLAGRAATLAAPTTPRGLLLLEQKNLLEDELGVLLGFKQNPTLEHAANALEQRSAVSLPVLQALRATARDAAQVETAMISGGSLQVSLATLVRAEKVRLQAVEELMARRKAALTPSGESS